MSHPGPDPAPVWQQPRIVLSGPGLVSGEDPEPPMWAQPADLAEQQAELAPMASAPPVKRGLRVVDAVFGRLPEPRLIVRNLFLWAGVALVGGLLQVHWWTLLAAGLGIVTALVNLIRWQRWRP